jgi:chromosome segregation ATPase
LEDVEFQYKQSQTDLELFLASNQITILNRSIVNLNQKLDNQYDLLSAKYEELNLLEALLEDVYAVQDQIAPGTTSYGAKLGDMMAMANLRNNSSSLAMRTRTVQNGASSAIGHGSRIDLQINGLPVDVTEVATLEETTGLVNAIETRQARVEAEIEELSAALLEPDSQLAITVSVNDSQQPIHDLIERIQILQSRVEAQNTEARELQEARDQAWENYKSMQRKLAEVQLGSQITDSVVRTADFAVAPLKPASPRLLLNVLIGGVLGGILAVLAIFGEAYWQKPTET